MKRLLLCVITNAFVKMKQFFNSFIFCFYLQFATAQSEPLNVEINVNDLVIGGVSLGFFWHTERHWSLGVGLGNGSIEGVAKELVFEGDDLDALDIDLPFIVGLNARYFFRPKQNGFYTQLAVGNEIFRIRAEDKVQSNPNQFAVLSVGYLWKFNRKLPTGWYLNARIGANVVWNGGGVYKIGNTSYELRPVFPNPGLMLGYRF